MQGSFLAVFEATAATWCEKVSLRSILTSILDAEVSSMLDMEFAFSSKLAGVSLCEAFESLQG